MGGRITHSGPSGNSSQRKSSIGSMNVAINPTLKARSLWHLQTAFLLSAAVQVIRAARQYSPQFEILPHCLDHRNTNKSTLSVDD